MAKEYDACPDGYEGATALFKVRKGALFCINGDEPVKEGGIVRAPLGFADPEIIAQALEPADEAPAEKAKG